MESSRDPDAGNIVDVDPFRCRMWGLHDRLEEYITEDSCKPEIQSFLKHGQLVTVLGRPLVGDADHDIELIYGARRLFVARYLNAPLKVRVRELSDRQAIVAMDIENQQRRELSPYERGRSFVRWLQTGCFVSQDELARALGISPAQVSRLVKLARLPAVVVGAFSSPLDIREGWGLNLAQACDDPQRRRLIVRRARTITSKQTRSSADEICEQLLEAPERELKSRMRRRDEVVADPSGHPLFRVRRQSRTVTLVLPVEHLSADTLAQITSLVANILVTRSKRSTAANAGSEETAHATERRRAADAIYPVRIGTDAPRHIALEEAQ